MATAAEHRAEIDRINGEVATQAAKIAQLSTILDGKAGGGGGAVETCTVTINKNPFISFSCYYIDATLQKQSARITSDMQLEVQKNSYIIFGNGNVNGAIPDNNAEVFLFSGDLFCIYVFGDCTIEVE